MSASLRRRGRVEVVGTTSSFHERVVTAVTALTVAALLTMPARVVLQTLDVLCDNALPSQTIPSSPSPLEAK